MPKIKQFKKFLTPVTNYNKSKLPHKLINTLVIDVLQNSSDTLYKLKKKKFVFPTNPYGSKFYGKLLFSRQYFKFIYNIKTTDFLKRLIKKSTKKSGNSMINLLGLAESKLDVVLVRAGFFNSIKRASQAISHGKIKLNGNICKFPNTILKKNDMITIVDHKNTLIVQEQLAKGLSGFGLSWYLNEMSNYLKTFHKLSGKTSSNFKNYSNEYKILLKSIKSLEKSLFFNSFDNTMFNYKLDGLSKILASEFNSNDSISIDVPKPSLELLEVINQDLKKYQESLIELNTIIYKYTETAPENTLLKDYYKLLVEKSILPDVINRAHVLLNNYLIAIKPFVNSDYHFTHSLHSNIPQHLTVDFSNQTIHFNNPSKELFSIEQLILSEKVILSMK